MLSYPPHPTTLTSQQTIVDLSGCELSAAELLPMIRGKTLLDQHLTLTLTLTLILTLTLTLA